VVICFFLISVWLYHIKVVILYFYVHAFQSPSQLSAFQLPLAAFCLNLVAFRLSITPTAFCLNLAAFRLVSAFTAFSHFARGNITPAFPVFSLSPENIKLRSKTLQLQHWLALLQNYPDRFFYQRYRQYCHLRHSSRIHGSISHHPKSESFILIQAFNSANASSIGF